MNGEIKELTEEIHWIAGQLIRFKEAEAAAQEARAVAELAAELLPAVERSWLIAEARATLRAEVTGGQTPEIVTSAVSVARRIIEGAKKERRGVTNEKVTR